MALSLGAPPTLLDNPVHISPHSRGISYSQALSRAPSERAHNVSISHLCTQPWVLSISWTALPLLLARFPALTGTRLRDPASFPSISASPFSPPTSPTYRLRDPASAALGPPRQTSAHRHGRRTLHLAPPLPKMRSSSEVRQTGEHLAMQPPGTARRVPKWQQRLCLQSYTPSITTHMPVTISIHIKTADCNCSTTQQQSPRAHLTGALEPIYIVTGILLHHSRT